MATIATPSNEKEDKVVALKILVDREKNKVVFAEAGKDFVDALLSFLTLPIGTIVRLVGNESSIHSVRVGSLSTLYESVANLEEKHLWTPHCKEMLLQPRNSMEAYCQQLKLNIDDTEPIKFFVCDKHLDCRRKNGSLLSTFRNQRCRCGKLMSGVISTRNLTLENGFVEETATFIISDDLSVLPNDVGISGLLQKHGIDNMEALVEQTVDISKEEVVDLLKFALLSNTPMTDFILKKEQSLDNFNRGNQSQFEIRKVPSDEGRQMVVKLIIRKSNKKVLFAEAKEDFVDFLFSFLTFPLGGVLHMLEGFSSLRCVDKLYKSVIELCSDRYLSSQALKDKLAKPQCALQFKLSNQILPIGEACLPVFHSYTYTYNLNTYEVNSELKFVDPKSSTGELSSSRGFVKGPSMYMVTDDLAVTPLSSIATVSYLNRSKVSLSDLEETVLSIGLKEGLSILKASLTSTSALTNGLNQYMETIKEEN
ncbi:uncharacterized protein LOC133286284 [Gastrolobium bilobum]|uniref:uncharacterized protein LOC133286284 n=1 Tax=Gastrolobium bilobum TaxID=150636 RepID=UPI002AB22A09|nr:uncharacterized protein LOC133286284 [Gastrolobium bilobum]